MVENYVIIIKYRNKVINMYEEKTLILIKPDGVKLGIIGEIITRIERKGYRIEALKVAKASKEQLQDHYSELVNKTFYKEIETYMQEGPIIAVIASGTQIINVFHRMAGATNPSLANFGTIRGDFGHEYNDGILRNIVHSSDSLRQAKKEIKIWFPEMY